MKDLISNQLVKYLEARGVEHIFGLCGHTNIAVLSALSRAALEILTAPSRLVVAVVSAATSVSRLIRGHPA